MKSSSEKKTFEKLLFSIEKFNLSMLVGVNENCASFHPRIWLDAEDMTRILSLWATEKVLPNKKLFSIRCCLGEAFLSFFRWKEAGQIEFAQENEENGK